jgi:hypothetical protein
VGSSAPICSTNGASRLMARSLLVPKTFVSKTLPINVSILCRPAGPHGPRAYVLFRFDEIYSSSLRHTGPLVHGGHSSGYRSPSRLPRESPVLDEPTDGPGMAFAVGPWES